MGIFYNPPHPHIGAAQPGEPRKLTPASGPAVQNPPFRGSRVPAEVLACWVGFSVAIVLPNFCVPQPAASFPFQNAAAQAAVMAASWEAAPASPQLPRRLTPPQSGPSPQNPPFTGSKVGTEVLANWTAQILAIALPPSNLPPGLGSAVPLAGASIPIAVLAAWDAPAPAIQPVRRLTPPQSGPAPQNPPVIGARVPAAVLVAWIPPDPAPIVTRLLNPPIGIPAVNNPPFNGGAQFSLAAQLWWIPPPAQPPVARLLDPPVSGPAPQNPQFQGGRVSAEVLVSWLPAPPVPIVSRLLSPPIGATVAAFPFPPVRLDSILPWWQIVPPAAQVGRLIDPPISGPAPSPIVFPSRGVPPGSVSWWQAPPDFQLPRLILPASGPLISPCPPCDPEFLAAYRAALMRNGQPVTFVRNIGVAPHIRQVSATVTARVMTYTSDTDSVSRTDFSERKLGAITQGDRKLIVLCMDLYLAGFPVPLVKNDKAIVNGETLNITEVDPNTRQLAGAIELVATGV